MVVVGDGAGGIESRKETWEKLEYAGVEGS